MDEPIKGMGFDDPNEGLNAPKGKKMLLGIGINAYAAEKGLRPLNNAVRDVKEVAALLSKQYGVETLKLLTDDEASRVNIEQELYNLTQNPVLGEHDSLLIYYSGHGHLDANKRGYWVPVDAARGMVATYIANSRILELISDIKCRHVLLISDACFSGALLVRGEEPVEHQVAEEYEKRPSRWAFCSGRQDEVVADGPEGNHSPFADALLQELRLNTGPLNISRLADVVIRLTRRNYRQMPEAAPIFGVGDKGGQYIFTPKGYVTAQTVSNQPSYNVSGTSRQVSAAQLEPPVPTPIWMRPVFALGALISVITLLGIAGYLLGWFSTPEAKKAEMFLDVLTNLPDTIQTGQTLNVDFKLGNHGEAPARLKPLLALPNDATKIHSGENTILANGERTFTVNWQPNMVGAQSLQVVVEQKNGERDTFLLGSVAVKEKVPIISPPEKISITATKHPITTKNNPVSSKRTDEIKENNTLINPNNGTVEPEDTKQEMVTIFMDIPLDTEVSFEKGGKPYRAKRINDKLAFVVPKAWEGKEETIIYKRNGARSRAQQSLSRSDLKLPDSLRD